MTTFLEGLRCRECGAAYAAEPRSACDECFGPLDPAYDYDAIAAAISRRIDRRRARGRCGGTRRCCRRRRRTAWTWGTAAPRSAGRTAWAPSSALPNLWIKDETRNPTHSFKDRVVSVALTKAREFGFGTVACASTGNLAHAVAAHAAARRGWRRCTFVPAGLESGKLAAAAVYGGTLIEVDGTYDDVNRLCGEASGEYPWAFVNVNLRPYYAEGSKTIAFETAEQLGWRAPDHVVVPIASGALLTRIGKAFRELHTVGLLDEQPSVRVSGAQGVRVRPGRRGVRGGR